MKRQLDIARVKRMIDIVDAGIAVLSTMPKGAPNDAYEELRAWERAAQAILASLQNEHGATWNASGDAFTLRLAGIQSSCTGGAGGLLRNWRNAAQRRLEAEANVDQRHQIQGRGDRAPDQALEALRKLHTNYVKQCGKRFAHVPFRADAVPGWIYLPMDDIVMRPPLDDVVVVVDIDRGAAR